MPATYRHQLYRIVFLVLLGFGMNASRGSTVVAVRTPEGIVLGADSLMTVSNGGKVVGRKTGCKIHQAGDVVFASVGVEMYDDLSVAAAVEQTLGGDGPFAPKLIEADRVAARVLREIFTRIRSDSPAAYRQRIGQVVHAVVYATIQSAIPVLVVREFKLEQIDAAGNAAITTHVIICPGSDCAAANGRMVVGAGIHAEVDKLMVGAPVQTTPLLAWRQQVERLIHAEITAEPDKVGPPISVLELDATGAHWSRGRQGACTQELK